MAPVLAPSTDTEAPIAMNSVSYNAGRTVDIARTLVTAEQARGYYIEQGFQAPGLCLNENHRSASYFKNIRMR